MNSIRNAHNITSCIKTTSICPQTCAGGQFADKIPPAVMESMLINGHLRHLVSM